MRRGLECVSILNKPKVIIEPEVSITVNEEENLFEITNVRSQTVQITDAVTQTDLTSTDIANLMSELQARNMELYQMREEIASKTLNEDGFKKNDQKTAYFTGLSNSDLFFTVYHTIEGSLKIQHMSALTQFQQLLLTMMKLRFDFSFKYLSYEFNVSGSTISQIFYKTINILYDKFKNIVFWPEKDEMPEASREAVDNKIAFILHLFEIPTEAPSDKQLSAELTGSSGHSLKYLIGVTPYGTISLISELPPNLTGYEVLTENSELLENVLPGDVIMTGSDFLGDSCVKKKKGEIRAYKKTDNKLVPIDIGKTSNVTRLRNNIKSTIALLKQKYTILRGPVPMSVLSHKDGDSYTAIEKILCVCCCFINMCAPKHTMRVIEDTNEPT